MGGAFSAATSRCWSGSQPLSGALRDWLRARGARLSEVVQMRSMLVAPTGERQLVELKAVDAAWPLVGEALSPDPLPPTPSRGEREWFPHTPPPRSGRGLGGGGGCSADQIAGALANHGLLAERVVLDRLASILATLSASATRPLPSAAPCSASRTGRGPPPDRSPRADPARRAAVDRPDRSRLDGAVRGPRHAARPDRIPAILTELRRDFPGEGWRIRDPHDAAPGVTRFIDQTSLFLTLVGLTSLLVGGIGVANGVRAWLDARARTIATLRCLGAASA